MSQDKKEEKDFYFSPTHWVENSCDRNYKGDILNYKTRCYVNGIPYTEMVTKGDKPATHWRKDLVKVYSGTDYKITNKKEFI